MSFSYYIPSETKLKELNYLREHLNEVFKNKVISSNLDNNELTVELLEDSLINVVSYLKDNNKYSFNQLTDITAVDYPEREKRFAVVYHLLSLSHNLRIRIKINIKEEYIVPSIYQYYTSSDWYEREVFDMFGIYFGNHPDLRRILTDYGFVGHPLRKDFPLTGYSEVIYDEKLQKVKYKEIEIKEPYRDFNSINSWVFENNLIKKS